MAILGLDILIHDRPVGLSPEEQIAIYQQQLVEKHRRGEHPYGFMDRNCPLCQLSK